MHGSWHKRFEHTNGTYKKFFYVYAPFASSINFKTLNYKLISITRASPELDYVYSTRISSHSSLRKKNPRENTSVSLYNGRIIKINFTSDPFQNVAPVTSAYLDKTP